jgi:hypothetical protein
LVSQAPFLAAFNDLAEPAMALAEHAGESFWHQIQLNLPERLSQPRPHLKVGSSQFGLLKIHSMCFVRT